MPAGYPDKHWGKQNEDEGLKDHFPDILYYVWYVTVPTILDTYYEKFQLSVIV